MILQVMKHYAPAVLYSHLISQFAKQKKQQSKHGTQEQTMIGKKLKPRKCRWCHDEYMPWTSLQNTCKPDCAISYIKDKQDKAIRSHEMRVDKEKRAETRKAKESIKPRSQWLKEAQKEFNAFIRERDIDLPCISCNEYVNNSDLLTGSRWDCGHYLSRGAHPELRFEELNCAKQCSSCNGGSGRFAKKSSTVQKEYRINLIERIGLEKVEWLEGPHELKKYTIDDVKEIKQHYREQLKLIK